MKNRKLLLIVSLVLALTMSLGGTLAYLQDSDADVNTMVLGNVTITQNEHQRVKNADGTYKTDTIDGVNSYVLEVYENDKPLLPIVGDPNEPGDSPAFAGWDKNATVRMTQIGSYGGMQVFAGKNAQDKFVTVTNTGNSDAYVRTYVAIEVGSTENKNPHAEGKALVMTSDRAVDVKDVGTDKDTGAPWIVTDLGIVEINGNNYEVREYLYRGANDVNRHVNGVLPNGDTTYPSLCQVYVKHQATNEDLQNLDGNKNGKLDILVLSQAIQADGFVNAKTALDTGFGEATAKVAEWFGELYNEDGSVNEDKIGTPGDKWPSNDVPVLDSWENEANSNWGDPTEEGSNEYVIKTATELAAFAKSVNAGETYKGKIVKLDADIDLAGKNWTPIGNSTNKFQGTFDGQNHTISNLNVIMPTQSNVGLFGYTVNGEIKNLTVDNATVSGYLAVGVVAGQPYTTKYTDITVTGLIKVDGMAYVGGVGGRNAYASWTDITVNADEGSYVRADSVENGTAYRTYVGGVIGFMGEGGHSFTNVESNIDVFGSTCDVGGITGIAHYKNSFINCSSSGDVTIFNATEADESEELGGIAGVWHNQNDTKVTFTNCSFTGELSANFTEGVDLSDNTITGKAYSATGTGELIIN